VRARRRCTFKVDVKHWGKHAYSVTIVHVCFKHRMTRKGEGRCPKCREPMIKTWKGFRTGKRSDDTWWIESERIITERDDRIKRMKKEQMMKELGDNFIIL